MKTTSILGIILDFVFGLGALIRICTGNAEVYDYIVLFYTFSMLSYEIPKIIRERKKQEQQDGQPTGDDKNALCEP